VLHLIHVAESFNYDVNQALHQVCIGSDFDGLINPIWTCPSVDSLDSFKSNFIHAFPEFAKNNKDLVGLPDGFNINTFAEQLFFENGKNFLLERVRVILPQ